MNENSQILNYNIPVFSVFRTCWFYIKTELLIFNLLLKTSLQPFSDHLKFLPENNPRTQTKPPILAAKLTLFEESCKLGKQKYNHEASLMPTNNRWILAYLLDTFFLKTSIKG